MHQARHASRFHAALAAASVMLLAVGVARTQTVASTDAAIAAFEKIATVLQHPRCLNCHQPQSPLQGDVARLHMPRVIRGVDDKGASAMRCSNCHGQTNNASSGVPGAPHWQLAPAAMDWSGLSVAELCRRIKDPAFNGNRTLPALVEHMERDALVRWGWEPGRNRQPVPIAHQEFIGLLKVWADAGGACPN